MKRIFAVTASLLLVLSLGACATAPSATESTSTEEEQSELANPWTAAQSPTEAAEGAGVGYFDLPEDGTVLDEGGPINWDEYKYTKLLAEADGSVGSAELVVRKGVKRPAEEVSYDTTDVSGDYTEYAHTWEIEADGWTVTCFGNEESLAMKAIWMSDNFSYSIMVRGQGDLNDTYGLGEADIATLVGSIG